MAQRYQMTISVPQKMRDQMEQIKGENWSAIAQKAFQSRLDELLTDGPDRCCARALRDLRDQLTSALVMIEDQAAM